MKFSWLLFIATAICVVFVSCEKEINIPLQADEPKLIVEGSIANDQPPYLLLTQSTGFFDQIDFTNIKFVKNAIVFVTDLTANKKIQLFADTTLPFVFYTAKNTDPLYNDFKVGKPGHAYKLNITYENQDYSALSVLPNLVGLDSLYAEPEARFNDTLFNIKATITDPDTAGNFYKYFTQRRGPYYKQNKFYESFASRFDDAYFNGQTIPASLFLGFPENDLDVDSLFDAGAALGGIGDTITVKLSSMDRQVYKFWKTVDFAEGSVGNPFASPIQVQSNLSNDAAGVWAAYGNTYSTIIIK